MTLLHLYFFNLQFNLCWASTSERKERSHYRRSMIDRSIDDHHSPARACKMMSSSSPPVDAAPAKHSGHGGGRRKRKRRHGGGSGGGAPRRGTHGSQNRTTRCEHDDDPTHHMLDCTSSLHVHFDDLAERYPDFREAWADLKKRRNGELGAKQPSSSSSSSFSTHVDAAFNLALTRAILRRNFDLSLPSMPEGHLCPPVPNRLNYVLWLNSLLEQSSDGGYFEQQPAALLTPSASPAHRRIGIDIGCGASCIYPLLLTTNRFNPDVSFGGVNNSWTFFATDIDERSLKLATINVEDNGLGDRIELSLVPKSRRQLLAERGDAAIDSMNDTALFNSTPGPVMTAVEAYSKVVISKKKEDGPDDDTIRNGPVVFDFCMTNPPFYATEEEATVDRKGDGRSRTDMNVGEGVYPGGELGVVWDMVADSMELGDSMTWYTSMVSKKSSLVKLEGELRRRFGRGAVRTATFVQGKTTRWGIAWTHRQVAPRSPAVRVCGGLQEFDVEIPTANISSCGALDEVVGRVVSYCQWMMESKKLEMECTVGRKEDDIVEVVITGREQGDGAGATSTANGGSNCAFIIVVGIKAGGARDLKAETGNKDAERTLVNLKLECYCHSSSGMATIETFRSGVVCEIKRSNRRWRRMLARAEGAYMY